MPEKSKQLTVDEQFMQMALALARKGLGKTSPNPPVGAVLVVNGKVISSGWHQRCGRAHAERIALDRAGKKAKGATLYVTLEPCCHDGRTPPCVDRVLKSGVKRIVIGTTDPNPLVSGRSTRRLKLAGIHVLTGVLGAEASALIAPFAHYITTGRPLVTAKIAQTLDGKIATASGDSMWITSEAARRYARQRRNEFDAIIVGVKTILSDNPQLTAARRTKRLVKVILDPSLRMPPTARFLQNTDPGDCFIIITKKAPHTKIRQWKHQGVHVIKLGQKANIPWSNLLDMLGEHNITNVLIEGGGQTIGRALKEEAVNRMNIYVAPSVMGDSKAINSLDGRLCQTMKDLIHLDQIKLSKIGSDFLWDADVTYSRQKKKRV